MINLVVNPVITPATSIDSHRDSSRCYRDNIDVISCLTNSMIILTTGHSYDCSQEGLLDGYLDGSRGGSRDCSRDRSRDGSLDCSRDGSRDC